MIAMSPIEMAVFAFKVDVATASVVTAFKQASIPTILVKGPAIANWLYSADDPRFYNDTDLLLRKRDWPRALGLMKTLGFEDELAPLDHPRMESGSGYPWGRPSDEAAVDLHYTLFGIGADPEELWEVFSESSIREKVGGIDVTMPSHPARLLHIALHAVQHGGEAASKPMRDLRRAIGKISVEEWDEALALAWRLEAAKAFSMGLRLLPEGKLLADRIGAAHSESTNAALRLEQVQMAEGFEELANACGTRERLATVLQELFPNPEFMRWWRPLARRGRVGLLLTYMWRPIWLALHAIPGFVAWRRAQRR